MLKHGPLLATLKVPLTGGDDCWALVSSSVENIKGTHDVFFIYKREKPGSIIYFNE